MQRHWSGGEHADLCGRCVTNVAGNGEERKFAFN